MKISPIRNTTAKIDNPMYDEREVSVFTSSGEEYLFRMYRDNDTAEICEADALRADSVEADFNDTVYVPAEVVEAYLKIQPEMFAQLENK